MRPDPGPSKPPLAQQQPDILAPTQAPSLLRSVAAYLALLALAVGIIYAQFAQLPPSLGLDVRAQLALTSVGDAQNLVRALSSSDAHAGAVLALLASTYLTKYTFSLPGGSALNVVAGALYGTKRAVPLCAMLTALGSFGSYSLSALFGKALAARVGLLRRALASLRTRTAAATAAGDLAFVLLGLRLLPIVPVWLLNIASPHAGVPRMLFLLTAALGSLPYTYATCAAGTLLMSLDPRDPAASLVSPGSLLQLATIGVAALLPVIIRRWRASRN